jgi:hypothetical protein
MGCGGSKDEKGKDGDMENQGDAPAPAPAAAAPAPAGGTGKNPDTHQVSKGDLEKDGNAWVSPELTSMMNDYFTRYDLDGSGTINQTEELKQLSTNLVVKLELDMDVATIDKYVADAGDMTVKNWKFDEFKDWYLEKFQPLKCWMPNDCSSSDEESETGHLRQGTYDLTMADGYVVPFKLRYADGDHSQLYKRTANDEKLGWDANGRTLGLFTVVGDFNHDGKTCHFTKSYDVDCDASTKEPIFEFEGKIVDHKNIEGTWKNTESDPNAKVVLDKLGLGDSGKFTMVKRKKDE